MSDLETKKKLLHISDICHYKKRLFSKILCFSDFFPDFVSILDHEQIQAK